MAMNSGTRGYLLPCGRDVEGVWDGLDSPDEHAVLCPDCRAVRESLLVLREATAELVADDELAPPPGLTSRIMAAVRADVRRWDVVELPGEGPDSARISARAAAAVLRFAADGVPGVLARHCRVVEGDGGAVVELDIAVEAAELTPATVERVRERVTAAAGARIGWHTTTLDLTVVDVITP
jgi:hypothetical protein